MNIDGQSAFFAVGFVENTQINNENIFITPYSNLENPTFSSGTKLKIKLVM